MAAADHIWHFEGAAFTSQAAGSDIYARSSTDTWAAMCAPPFEPELSYSPGLPPHNFLLSLPSSLSLTHSFALSTLRTLPFVFCTHEFTGILQRAIIVRRRELTTLRLGNNGGKPSGE